MRIKRLELTSFRTFGHVVLEDIPDTVVLVSPNGLGKSSILEAILGAHELVSPYHRDDYEWKVVRANRGTVPVWPPHLPAPVKLGERQAEILLEVEPDKDEEEALSGELPEGRRGSVHLVIEEERVVSTRDASGTAQALFRYHPPSTGVGFLDYIRPTRLYQSRELQPSFVSDMRDERTRELLAGFRDWQHQHDKFSLTKSYVASCELSDLSHLKETDQRVDTLRGFKEVFDFLFSPKRFLGYRGGPLGDIRIMVGTPSGEHDVDWLSDGEKEMLHILMHLFRFRELPNVVLWDTPELHLNASLEGRLLEAVRRLAPRNQYWIATHSLELIGSAEEESIFALRPGVDGVTAERIDEPQRRAKARIYRELGAQVGLQLVSSKVVFCEGKDAHSDRRLLERLVGDRVRGATFVAGGSCRAVLSVGSRAHQLLEDATVNGDFLAVVDRDFMSREDAEALEAQHDQRVFVWRVHEIENLFLDPEVVLATLRHLDQVLGLDDLDAVRCALDSAARAIQERVAAQWTAWEFGRSYPRIDNVAGAADPLIALLAHAEKLKSRAECLADPQRIRKSFEEKLEQVGRIIDEGRARHELPGKELLQELLRTSPSLSAETYLAAAVSIVLERKLVLPQIERLVGVLERDAECCVAAPQPKA